MLSFISQKYTHILLFVVVLAVILSFESECTAAKTKGKDAKPSNSTSTASTKALPPSNSTGPVDPNGHQHNSTAKGHERNARHWVGCHACGGQGGQGGRPGQPGSPGKRSLNLS